MEMKDKLDHTRCFLTSGDEGIMALSLLKGNIPINKSNNNIRSKMVANNDNNNNDEGQHRVIKYSLYRLVRGGQNEVQGRLIVSSIEKLVILNSQIAVRGSMVMNRLAIHCLTQNIPLPQLTKQLIADAFNYNPRSGIDSISSDIIREVVGRESSSFKSFPMPFLGDSLYGRAWLTDNLVRMYSANIKASIKGRWNSVIKHSIASHLKIHYDELGKNAKKNKSNQIYQRVTRPITEENDLDCLAVVDRELVAFHRNGFGVENNHWIKYQIDVQLATVEGVTSIISHFLHCLHKQCSLENDENKFKKTLPLPQFHIHRISINIDQKGMYFVAKQYLKELSSNDPQLSIEQLNNMLGTWPNFNNESYQIWLKKLFNIGEFLSDIRGFDHESKKRFVWQGLSITTDGVKASLHYCIKNNNVADGPRNNDGNDEKKGQKEIETDDEKHSKPSSVSTSVEVGPNGK